MEDRIHSTCTKCKAELRKNSSHCDSRSCPWCYKCAGRS